MNNPLATVAGTGAAASIPGLGPVMAVLTAAKSANDLFGPQGGITTGDPGKIMSGIQGGMGAYNGLTGSMGGGGPALQSTLGMSKDQFDAYPPEVRQELLRKVMGR